jgi:hypothetical protein
MKGKNATKNQKKAPNPNAGKASSDYQNGKKSVSQIDASSSKKK